MPHRGTSEWTRVAPGAERKSEGGARATGCQIVLRFHHYPEDGLMSNYKILLEMHPNIICDIPYI